MTPRVQSSSLQNNENRFPLFKVICVGFSGGSLTCWISIHTDATVVRAQTSVLFGVLTRHLALHMLRSRNIPASPRGTVTSVPILQRGNPGNQRLVPCPGHRPQGTPLDLSSLPTQRDPGSPAAAAGMGTCSSNSGWSVSPWRQGLSAEINRGSATSGWPEGEPLGR